MPEEDLQQKISQFATLSNRIPGVIIRRSRTSDAPALAELVRLRHVAEDGLPNRGVFTVRSELDFVDLIETSFLCLTAVSGIRKNLVLGFIALNDSPRVIGISARRWDTFLLDGHYEFPEGVCPSEIKPCNTLWLNMLLSPPTSTHMTGTPPELDASLYKLEMEMEAKPFTSLELHNELFSVALGTTPHTENIFFALPPGTAFPLVEQSAKPLIRGVARRASKDSSFTGDILHISRNVFVPKLLLRLGRIQDYDDFVPLLVKGRGVLTHLPEEFYLEEILKDQDDVNKVVIAENSINHQVVGLACLRALSSEETQLVKQYDTEVINKLRTVGLSPNVLEAKEKVSDVPELGGNTFKIDFLYFNPDYDGSASEFVPFMFKQFPMCEYAAIILPHDLDEPPMLRSFHYHPIRKYQPHNAKGEFVRVPLGLWLCCRYTLDEVEVTVTRTATQASATEAFLEVSMHGSGMDVRNRIHEDLSLSLNRENIESRSLVRPLPQVTAFSLHWGENAEVVGAASARRLTIHDMYAIRANYDLDAYVNFYAHTGKDYTTTDIFLTPTEGKEKFYSAEMPGVLVRAMFVRPPFRHAVRFFVREILRHYACEVALVLATPESEPFRPLITELLPTRPRRVIERTLQEKEEERSSREKILRRQEEEEEELEDEPELLDGTMPIEQSALSQSGSKVDMPTGPLTPAKRVVVGEFDGDVAALGALYFTTRRSLGDEKKRVNTRIAVVGSGSTGLAFLHRLLCIPYVSFTNLFLVSTDGMPMHPNHEEYLWGVDKMELLEREHASLLIGYPIRIVMGTMVDMDKVNRFLSVDNGSFQPYDFLVLTPGRQYVTPNPMQRLLQQENRSPMDSIIPVCGELAVSRLRQKLAEIEQNPNNFANILIYGSGLEAFAIATAVVQLGFSSQRIVLCAPEDDTSFMDHACYQAAVALFKSMGINALRSYDVSRLEYDDDNNLTTVMLVPVTSDGTKAGESVELACSLVLCVEDKDIDPNVLSTLNKRSIVFDGRVIVQNNYKTTDPRVFAAGPLAMFTRRYGTTQNFEDFHARDIGYHLAVVLMGFLGFDEFFDPKFHRSQVEGEGSQYPGDEASPYIKVLEENGSKIAAQRAMRRTQLQEAFTETLALETLHRLPKYTTPLCRRVRFPCGYTFFQAMCVNFNSTRCIRLDCSNLDLSNLFSPMELGGQLDVSKSLDDVEASAPVGEQNLLAIYVNESSRAIDCVTFFGNGTAEVHNYAALIGYPETILNLVFRYREAILLAQERGEDSFPGLGLTAGVLNGRLNLMEYFRLPHLQTVFYDRFSTFFQELSESCKAHEEGIRMREQILRDHQLDCSLSETQIAAYQLELTKAQSAFKYNVQLELIRFLHENKDFRPQNMYLPNIEEQMRERHQIKTTVLSSDSSVNPVKSP